MIWVLVFLAIAFAGLVVVVGYAVWLAHKTADVLAEAGVLAERVGQLGDLLGQVGSGDDQRRDPAGRRLGGGLGRP